MKNKLLLAVFFILPFIVLKAQNNVTYIIGKTVKYDAAKLDAALKNCSLENYRREDQRVVMNFDDDTKVELLSLNEIKNKGTANSIKEPLVLGNTFILVPDGYITENVRKLLTPSERKDSIINAQKNNIKK